MVRRERRRYKRIKRNFIVRFRSKLDKDRKRPKGWNMAILEDLGAGGALFKYREKLEIGSHVDFQLKSPISRPPITCVGKIIRVDEEPPVPIYNVAVVFLRIREEEREKIEKFVEIFTPG